MKRFAVSAMSSLLAFVAGLATASSWNSNISRVMHEPPVLVERCPSNQTQSPVLTEASHPIIAPKNELVFAQGLRLVPELVSLKSESLRYDIDVSYPQITGTEDSHIRRINQHIKDVATKKYQWALNPSKENMRLAQEEYPGTFNTVLVDFQVGIATDSFLSIYFFGYSHVVGSDNAAGESLTVNYDLASGKELKLSDIFKSGSKYLEFISSYCIDELSRDNKRGALFRKALAPAAENFKNWNITANGITFNFDGCKIFNCAQGDQTVEIPFGDLQQLLNPGIPGKFKIAYP
jgi:Protein of unknown function (DUF3298)/Deacetylase PdaC